jgi:hypothetical protein
MQGEEPDLTDVSASDKKMIKLFILLQA